MIRLRKAVEMAFENPLAHRGRGATGSFSSQSSTTHLFGRSRSSWGGRKRRGICRGSTWRRHRWLLGKSLSVHVYSRQGKQMNRKEHTLFKAVPRLSRLSNLAPLSSSPPVATPLTAAGPVAAAAALKRTAAPEDCDQVLESLLA